MKEKEELEVEELCIAEYKVSSSIADSIIEEKSFSCSAKTLNEALQGIAILKNMSEVKQK